MTVRRPAASGQHAEPPMGKMVATNCGGRRRLSPQWLIIQGRAPGNVLAPAFRLALPEQQPQDGGCRPADRAGAWALRSLVACAPRLCAGMHAKAGAVSNTRGATVPHRSHAIGKANSAIGRIAVNGPQPGQSYS
jgi:hypothetical protein